ncbi:dethiobiotin synthase, partial [Salmonella enterica subsp. enterica]|nr:dethiobiotin synthase [Salmonella enterica subsp. enterica]
TEGAGGWFTPLSATLTFADWVQTEQLPVILVVGVKLGCINHAMLTALAVEQAGLPLVGWIANDIQPPGARHGEYLATLRRVIPAPLLGEIPWLGVSPSQAATGQYLDLSPLERA